MAKKKLTSERKDDLVDRASDLFFDTISQAIHEDFAIKSKEEFDTVRTALVNYIQGMEYDADNFG